MNYSSFIFTEIVMERYAGAARASIRIKIGEKLKDERTSFKLKYRIITIKRPVA